MISSSDILNAKVLIVDDQQINVLLLERMLRGAGYTSIASTTDPRQVCELHRENRYDLILLDLQMPGMDGFMVMDGLKQIETEGYLPVLVITAQPEHKLRALKAGAKDFVSKPFDIVEVQARVHNLLEVRLLHLQTKALYDQIVAEQKVSERLLLNVLPPAIAERLKAGETTIADSFPDVTVLFADLVGFTELSSQIPARQLVSLLNDIFSMFDLLAEKLHLEKLKTIGDAYMAVSGLPKPRADHAETAAEMALGIQSELARFNLERGTHLQARVGIHTGPVVAGVIGKTKFSYDLWGDTANVASRMESHGVAGGIQVSSVTYERLKEKYAFEERGCVPIKGKGEMKTYLLFRKILNPPMS